MKKFNRVYNPGILDLLDPTVIQGEIIPAGTHVRIAREFNPPMYPTRVFCMIQDATGNVASVYKWTIETKVTGGK